MKRNKSGSWTTVRTGSFRIAPALLLVAGCASTPGAAQSGPKGEVIVMGMIHGEHRTRPLYGIEVIQDYVRKINPDYILCEIPPDRFETAMDEFRKTGTVAEPRVRRFPEYVEAIFPLQEEMRFEIIPCAGWTKAMSDDRREKLEQWTMTRPLESAEVDRAEKEMDRRLEKEGMEDDPRAIHTDRYDAIIKRGIEPYNRLFNEDLGPGGWDNINTAHYALITRALGAHKYEGKRFLITFGAAHKYWFIERLRKRNDIVLRRPEEFLGE
ncbi:MAG: hypothetical protein IID36_13105 [Planctomycetes bacterium]|nr:hypothetical protein [Planctomycetota bacterium]